MSKRPHAPSEQTPRGTPAATPDDDAVQPSAGSSDRNLDQQGRHGDIRQNTTHQGLPRDRGA